MDAQASPDAESSSKEAEKLEWKKILVAIQIKVAAAKRQLRKIDAATGDSHELEISTKGILDISETSWEVSIIHGRILEEEIANEDLESRANRLEDTIFEIKDLCNKMIRQAKNKPASSSIKIPEDMDEASITPSPPKLSHFNDPNTGEREPSGSVLVGSR